MSGLLKRIEGMGIQLPILDHRLDLAELILSQHSGEKVAGLGENPSALQILHHFTPGMYIRECRIPAGYTLVTKIHKTTHPFMVVEGACVVGSLADGPQEILAPHFGITKIGTRRIIETITPVRWFTFHPTELTDPVEIEKTLIEEHSNAVETWITEQEEEPGQAPEGVLDDLRGDR